MVLPPGTDLDALGTALDHVVAHHEALRTTLRLHEGELEQVVGVDPERRSCTVDELAALEGEPFDLVAGGPLVRVVRRQGGRSHILSLVVHHAVIDGWGLSLVLAQLRAAHAAAVAGDPLPAVRRTSSSATSASGSRTRPPLVTTTTTCAGSSTTCAA